MESIKFFVVNIDKETLDKSLEFLNSKGFEADGEIDPEKASALFPLKNYDMAVFGGGLSGKIKEALKKEFLSVNKELEIIEHTSHPTEMYEELVEAFKD
jgi:predicted transcriptional regulator